MLQLLKLIQLQGRCTPAALWKKLSNKACGGSARVVAAEPGVDTLFTTETRQERPAVAGRQTGSCEGDERKLGGDGKWECRKETQKMLIVASANKVLLSHRRLCGCCG